MARCVPEIGRVRASWAPRGSVCGELAALVGRAPRRVHSAPAGGSGKLVPGYMLGRKRAGVNSRGSWVSHASRAVPGHRADILERPNQETSQYGWKTKEAAD